MELAEDDQAQQLLAHLEQCPDCRAMFEQARRGHLDRIRMYDQFDRGHDSLREQLMAALPPIPVASHADRLFRAWRHTGDFAMSIKHRVNARAAIGVVSVAACIAFLVLTLTFSGNKDAFAAAIQQFQNSRTIICRLSSSAQVSGMNVQQTGKLYFSSEYGSRSELGNAGQPMMIQYAPQSGPQMTVLPLTKQYIVITDNSVQPQASTGSSPDEFIVALSKLQGQATRELGRMNIEGVEVAGYEISGQMLGLGSADNIRSELWVDVQTHLPVRYVADITTVEPVTSCQLVYDHFEWDSPLDPALFTPDIPAEYTRIDAKVPTSDESSLVKALSNYAELTGEYPSSLQASSVMMEFSTKLGTRLGAALARGEKAPDQQAMMQKSVEIGSGLKYYQRLTQSDATPEYFGKTVKPGQADAVLLRWKLPDGHFRVIYGDLKIDTVPNP